MKKYIIAFYLVGMSGGLVSAQDYVSKVWVSDQGDGTYKNPVLYADYSDPDACRVGDDYYLTKQGRKRNRKKSFWVTDREWKAIEKIAAGTGMGIGEYLRISALGKTIYQVEELKPILHELKGIGRNLNQLTMLSHQGVVRTVNLTATADGIGRCYQAINKLYADTDAVIQGGG